MNFANLSFWLWLLAGLASVFMLLSAYSLFSWLIGLRGAIPLSKGLSPSRLGDSDAYPHPKKSTAIQIAKMMLLLAALLLAYDAGARINHSKEYAAWKERSLIYQHDHAEYQKAYAAWQARQIKENR